MMDVSDGHRMMNRDALGATNIKDLPEIKWVHHCFL